MLSVFQIFPPQRATQDTDTLTQLALSAQVGEESAWARYSDTGGRGQFQSTASPPGAAGYIN